MGNNSMMWIKVELEDENSCKKCPCLAWDKYKLIMTGCGWLCGNHHVKTATTRPASCRANDVAKIPRIGRELQEIVDGHASVDEQGRTVIKESNFEILQSNIRGYIGSLWANDAKPEPDELNSRRKGGDKMGENPANGLPEQGEVGCCSLLTDLENLVDELEDRINPILAPDTRAKSTDDESSEGTPSGSVLKKLETLRDKLTSVKSRVQL